MDDIFVFGSNLAGRHGKGAALFARRHYGARTGTGRGITGLSYALPTKDAQLNPLPLFDIGYYAREFLEYAEKYRETARFLLTAVGCGLAGYATSEILPLFSGAPANVWFPGIWLAECFPVRRIIVAGSRGFSDEDALFSRLDESLERCRVHRVELELVSGTARGADSLGEFWAQSRGIPVQRFPAHWDRYGKAAGMVRNAEMARYGSHLIAFWDGQSPGTRNMIETAEGFGLPVDIVQEES